MLAGTERSTWPLQGMRWDSMPSARARSWSWRLGLEELEKIPRMLVVALLVEGAGEVEDDGFGTVHSSAGDDVEDPHGCGALAVEGSVSGSWRLSVAQSLA
jgi:hypothetical protein